MKTTFHIWSSYVLLIISLLVAWLVIVSPLQTMQNNQAVIIGNQIEISKHLQIISSDQSDVTASIALIAGILESASRSISSTATVLERLTDALARSKQ